ncbi:MAG: hypothetical protein JWO54_346 [Candidatus Saccharibacteria bacterium]|nr:hypothetical protein [Candidatus Saccharibacteria bacterium]MDB5180588.1 hypothetical protein [Candidatus Saccharibacteria bacterium]
MAELIGHFIANWPMWIALPVILIASFLWVFLYGANVSLYKSPRYEWPEDKKKRLAKQRNKSLKKGKV